MAPNAQAGAFSQPRIIGRARPLADTVRMRGGPTDIELSLSERTYPVALNSSAIAANRCCSARRWWSATSPQPSAIARSYTRAARS